MITHSSVIATVLAVDACALLLYNVAGMCVTGHLGAVFRQVWLMLQCALHDTWVWVLNHDRSAAGLCWRLPAPSLCGSSTWCAERLLACLFHVVRTRQRVGMCKKRAAMSKWNFIPFLCALTQLLFYTPLGLGKLGESWSVYSWIQAVG
jgi:hypothetical protein